jgi:uncharacterized protein
MNILSLLPGVVLLLSLSTAAFSQKKMNKPPDQHKHRVIMQVTQSDSLTQVSVVGQIRNIMKSLPGVEIEVVCHANALDMLISGRSKVASHIGELSGKNVVFAACENTMERKKIKKEDLLPGVITVPSALVEIILKQEQGWSYLKAGF